MLWATLTAAVILFAGAGIRSIPKSERGVVMRLGRNTNKVVGPGVVFTIPFLETLQRVSVVPFSVSMPPQSAITRDEIPIQLQASLDAIVRDPVTAVSKSKDWRVFLMSRLQDLMKEQLEDLDFDNLESVFPSWVESIRRQLDHAAEEIGAEVTALQISNLSPRTKPS